jgi:hypothetical protein
MIAWQWAINILDVQKMYFQRACAVSLRLYTMWDYRQPVQLAPKKIYSFLFHINNVVAMTIEFSWFMHRNDVVLNGVKCMYTQRIVSLLVKFFLVSTAYILTNANSRFYIFLLWFILVFMAFHLNQIGWVLIAILWAWESFKGLERSMLLRSDPSRLNIHMVSYQ